MNLYLRKRFNPYEYIDESENLTQFLLEWGAATVGFLK